MDSLVGRITYTPRRSCFIVIPRKPLPPGPAGDEIQVFKATYGNEQTAYFTCSPDGFSSVDEEIQINGLYANKLGIKEKEEVILEQVRSVPFCERVCVDPLSVDDWEILDINASFIESHMLNQVRVVWDGQVLPVWVQSSVCLFLKIGGMEPVSACGLLGSETRVVVSPCVRHRHSARKTGKAKDVLAQQPSALDQSAGPTASNTKEAPSNQNSLDGSLISRLVQKIFYFSGSAQEASGETKHEPIGLDPPALRMNLRVQGSGEVLDGNLTNFIFHKKCSSNTPHPEHILLNPGLVFVNAEDVTKQNSHLKDVPKVFFAKLKKLTSPRAKLEVEKQRPGDSKISSAASSAVDKLAKTLVQVIVVNSQGELADHRYIDIVKHATKWGLLPGHMLVPSVLRRILQLEVTGRVMLKSIKTQQVAAVAVCIIPLSLMDAARMCGELAQQLAVVHSFLDGHWTALQQTGNLFHRADQLYGLYDNTQQLSQQEIIKAFILWIQKTTSADHPLLVFNGQLISFKAGENHCVEAMLAFREKRFHQNRYIQLYPEVMNKIQLSVKQDMNKQNGQLTFVSALGQSLSEIDPKLNCLPLENLSGVKAQSRQAITHLELCLRERSHSNLGLIALFGMHHGMLLITGPRGAGKSTFAMAICNQLLKLPVLTYPVFVSCKSLTGKKVAAVQSILQQHFEDAAWRQPSVIVLDDLDYLCGAETEFELDLSESGKMASVLKDLLKKEMTNNSRTAVIATSESQSSIHPSLILSRGIHYVQEVVHIDSPDEGTREEILKSMMEINRAVSSDSAAKLDLKSVVTRTEGFVVQDLKKLLNRAIHANLIHQQKDGAGIENEDVLGLIGFELDLKQEDFDTALEGFTPLTLRQVQLHEPGTLSWQNVGGLKKIKENLIETFIWPSKYPYLFSQCKLRFRSGVLLFGAPGTGKTLLVAALAKESHMNFITVKGPELLNKYVGASENAVRNTFGRAEKAKPCLIFFDEFDSLAPRRGHDSTGVTDRVVNQLLTQMDGVESLEGIYVIAATSRPDLIDPALLRPGRLDKCLCCEIPTEDERLEILKVLTEKMMLSNDVDLLCFARQCIHFTGADLKALLYNAQLEAIHQITNKKIKMGKSAAIHSGRELMPVEGSSAKYGERQDRNTLEVTSVAHIPNLETGPVNLTPPTAARIEKEVHRIRHRSHSMRENLQMETEVIVVAHEHLKKAMDKMKPSVSASERMKYSEIYKNFIKSRGSLNAVLPVPQQKYTLA